MFNRKGEISTLVVLGVFAIIGVAALMNSTVTNQRTNLSSKAAESACKNNPVDPPAGGYTWVANCSKTCNTNTDCPKNTSDPGNVNPDTSNWCFGFPDGNKCMQLQKGSIGSTQTGTSTGTSTNTSTQPTSGAVSNGSGCTRAIGCGGKCDNSFNNGCGYGGCREWEQCVNNTCIDTTQLGTQPASVDACHEKASANSAENVLPTGSNNATATITPRPTTGSTTGTNQSSSNNSGKTSVPTPTKSPNTTDGFCTYPGDTDCITLTPAKQACHPDEYRCADGTCVETRDACPVVTKAPTPTQSKIFIPTFNSGNSVISTPVPTPIPVVITTNQDTILKSCWQGGTLVIVGNCFLEKGKEVLGIK